MKPEVLAWIESTGADLSEPFSVNFKREKPDEKSSPVIVTLTADQVYNTSFLVAEDGTWTPK